jgi:hypothetical protein
VTWVKRHRWGLTALAVLVPAALLAAMSIVWFRYMDAVAQHPVIVARGDTGTYQATQPVPEHGEGGAAAGPAELSLTDYTVVSWDSETGRSVALLEGTEAVSAVIHVDARGLGEDTFGCEAVLIAPGPEGDRVWESALSGDIDYYPSGDLEAFCSLNDGDEFDWEAVFVVPEGVAADARLIITDGSFQPRYQLELEH